MDMKGRFFQRQIIICLQSHNCRCVKMNNFLFILFHYTGFLRQAIHLNNNIISSVHTVSTASSPFVLGETQERQKKQQINEIRLATPISSSEYELCLRRASGLNEEA